MHQTLILFIFFERVFLIRTPIKHFQAFVVQIFRKKLEAFDLIDSFLDQIIELIDKIRINKEKLTNVEEWRSVFAFIYKSGLYKEKFETMLCIKTQKLYAEIAKRLMERFDIIVFLNQLQEFEKIENEISQIYPHKGTLSRLEEILFVQFLGENLQDSLQYGIPVLFDRNMTKEMKYFFENISRIKKTEFFKSMWNYEIKKVGCLQLLPSGNPDFSLLPGLVMNPKEKPQEAVVIMSQLLALQQKTDFFLSYCFSGSPEMKSATLRAFEDFVNTRPNQIAQAFSTYLDFYMRSINKNSVFPESMENHLSRVVSLFRFLSAKDVFEVFYDRRMVRRVLSHESAEMKAEKVMLAKFQAECGSSFAKRSNDFFNELVFSEKTCDDFLKHYTPTIGGGETGSKGRGAEGVGVPFDFSLTLFSSSTWPFPPQPINPSGLPVFHKTIKAFKQFYASLNPASTVSFQHQCSTCTLTFSPRPNSKYWIDVSWLQAIVLLMLSEKKNGFLAISEFVKEVEGLEDEEEVKKSLGCIVAAGIILERNNGWKINYKFENPSKMIKVEGNGFEETVIHNSSLSHFK